MQVTTIGLDLAKNIFQVHGVSETGEVAFNKPLRRAQILGFFSKLPPCLVGMEACGSSHYWARELSKFGHDIRLIPPSYVKPYVKRGKSDAADAEAICEAVTRPTMRFVRVKSPEQQALLSLHRARDLVVRQRTQIVNMLRSLLAEFGIIVRQGITAIMAFSKRVASGNVIELPNIAQEIIGNLCHQLLALKKRVDWYMRKITAHARSDARVKRLLSIPGVGPVTASAIVSTIGDGRQFKSGRDLAAWLGLTPLNRSSGGKERLGKISKMGDRYIRRLLVVGMTARLKTHANTPERSEPWVARLLENKPSRLATVAMANRTARIIWALLTKEETYRPRLS
jgi:transposase